MNTESLRDLQMLAVREALDEIVGADVLINTALNALLDGVESETLPLLAGLSKREEGEAHDLFTKVCGELDLTPPTPINTVEARWDLARWTCEQIAAGTIEPEAGGRLIWYRCWNELDYPAVLQPMVGWVSEWDDWSPTWEVDREHYRELIVSEARSLLAGPLPPP